MSISSLWQRLTRGLSDVPSPAQAAMATITYVRGLNPAAVDGGTGHVADQLVAAWLKVWIADADARSQRTFNHASARLAVALARARVAVARASNRLQEQVRLAVAVAHAQARLRVDGHDLAYRDHAPLARASAERRWYVIVMVLTAGVDVAAFQSVLALVMRNSPTWLVWFFVTGLTVGALTLTHFAGQDLRNQRMQTGSSKPRWGSWSVYAGAWLLMGVLAFIVRCIVPDQVRRTDQIGSTVASGAPASMAYLKAGMFLSIFIATGLIAMAVALRQDPPADAFRRLFRALARAERRANRARSRANKSIAKARIAHGRQASALSTWEAARRGLVGRAEHSMAVARARVAQRMAKPAAVGGLTDDAISPRYQPPALPTPMPLPDFDREMTFDRQLPLVSDAGRDDLEESA